VSTVILRLIGPLQSWGIQSRFGNRDTQLEPTKSGVIGIVAAALGMQREDDAYLATLTQCQMAVRVDVEGRRMRDYHVTGGGTFKGLPYGVWESDGFHGKTVLSDRFYITNAAFHVGLEYDDHALVERIANALRNPVFPLALGRRTCVPTVPIYADVRDGSVREALLHMPLYVSTESRHAHPERIRMIVECASHEGQSVPDVPLSFATQRRSFGVRYTKNEWVDRTIFPSEEVLS
jgi:CRISPR system Cascade subunit CasD